MLSGVGNTSKIYGILESKVTCVKGHGAEVDGNPSFTVLTVSLINVGEKILSHVSSVARATPRKILRVFH